jgi:hypothetical protein
VPRTRHQLAIQAGPELIARIRAEASARGCTISALVCRWCEQGLSGDAPQALACPPPPAPGVEELSAVLADAMRRLSTLEGQVARLREQRRR